MSIESVMPSTHLILCHPLLLLPSIPPSIRVFSSESAVRMRWPKYWSFSFSIIPSKEIPGLISFRMDRRAWWAAVHRVVESHTTEHAGSQEERGWRDVQDQISPGQRASKLFSKQWEAREGLPWGMTPSDLGSGKSTVAHHENCQQA